MPEKIEQLAKTLLKEPVEVKLQVSRPADKIRQQAYICHENQKPGIISDLFKRDELKRVIIFAGSKLKVKEVNRSLRRMHINCDEMHSDLSQAERDEVMYRFKSGQTDVLVATDIVARGIDIDDISIVINYDVPHDAEDYVHRVGRTARADRDGRAITLVRGKEIGDFMDIERFLGRELDKLPLPEGLGEGPEYIRGKYGKGRPQGKRNYKGKKGGGKPQNKSSQKRKEHKRGSHKKGNKENLPTQN